MFVVLVGLLAAGLQTLEFRAGLTMPDAGVPDTGEQVRLPFPYAFLERLLDSMPWIAMGVVILAAVILRRRFFQALRWRGAVTVIGFMVLLAIIGLSQGQPVNEEDPGLDEPENGKPAQTWQPAVPSPDHWGDAESLVPAELPPWAAYLAAVAGLACRAQNGQAISKGDTGGCVA